MTWILVKDPYDFRPSKKALKFLCHISGHHHHLPVHQVSASGQRSTKPKLRVNSELCEKIAASKISAGTKTVKFSFTTMNFM